MKIIILINTLSPGGAERQVVTDANILANNGYDVTIAYQKNDSLIELVDNRVNFFKIKSANVIFASFELFKFLFNNRFDIIFAHMYWAHKVAAIPSFLTKHRLIFFEHGLGLWRKWYHIAIIRFISIFSEKIVTVSHAKKRIKIEREHFNSKKLLVIPNCFKPSFIILKKSNLVNRTNNNFIIGFSGRLNKIKQLHLLIEVALLIKKKIKAFQFVLLGEGVCRKELQETITENGLNAFFTFMGYVKDPEKHLLTFDVFVLPSLREDLSLALIEAGFCGIPSIAFDVGGNSEIIINNQTGFLVDPFNLNEFAKFLIFLYENPVKRKNMGHKAKEYANNHFTENRRLESLEKIFV